jgi:rod shape-determining protein MreC
MRRAPERSVSRRDHFLFAACLLVSAGAIAAPAPVALSVAGGVRDTVLAPLVWLQQFGAEGRTSRARLAALQAERDSVALVGMTLPELEAENAELRRLLGLPDRVRQEWTSAEVLHQPVPTDGRSILLSVGTAAGVAPHAPVIAAEGLLGVVVQAGPVSSVALTWAHPEYRVSAVTLDGSVQGIVAAASTPEASEAFLEFRGVAFRDTIPVGTLVVTSGLTGVYPRGIPIGRVAGVRREQLGWERVYRLTPLANPSRAGHVMILRTGRTPAGGFPADTAGSR